MSCFLLVPRVSIIGIEGFRCPVDLMDEEPDDILDLSLILYVILRPRFGMSPHSHPHDKPLGQFKNILVRLIIADKKQACQPEVHHEG